MCGECSLLGCASRRREVEILEASLQELRKEISTFLHEREKGKNALPDTVKNQSEEHNDALRTLLLQAVQSISHGGWIIVVEFPLFLLM